MKHVIIFLVFIFFTAGNAQAEIRFITNKDVTDKKLTANEIKDIFLGKKKKWSDHTKIHFVTSGNETLHNQFLKTYIYKTINQYNAYWKNMLFTGKGSPPKQYTSTGDIIEYVTNTQGAIGYIDSGSATVNVNIISVE